MHALPGRIDAPAGTFSVAVCAKPHQISGEDIVSRISRLSVVRARYLRRTVQRMRRAERRSS